jgi:hypothetical protein
VIARSRIARRDAPAKDDAPDKCPARRSRSTLAGRWSSRADLGVRGRLALDLAHAAPLRARHRPAVLQRLSCQANTFLADAGIPAGDDVTCFIAWLSAERADQLCWRRAWRFKQAFPQHNRSLRSRRWQLASDCQDFQSDALPLPFRQSLLVALASFRNTGAGVRESRFKFRSCNARAIRSAWLADRALNDWEAGLLRRVLRTTPDWPERDRRVMVIERDDSRKGQRVTLQVRVRHAVQR